MNVKTRFVSAPAHSASFATYMGSPLAERLEVSLEGPTVCVALYPYSGWVGGRDDPGKETRAEFGERLRRAAREATRGFEKAILDSLREQGHLV
jgi:hypothetical protein